MEYRGDVFGVFRLGGVLVSVYLLLMFIEGISFIVVMCVYYTPRMAICSTKYTNSHPSKYVHCCFYVRSNMKTIVDGRIVFVGIVR